MMAITRERVIEILNECGYFTTTEFEDNFEIFRNETGVSIYLSNSYLESEHYPIPYYFKFEGCERGATAYILGINSR